MATGILNSVINAFTPKHQDTPHLNTGRKFFPGSPIASAQSKVKQSGSAFFPKFPTQSPKNAPQSDIPKTSSPHSKPALTIDPTTEEYVPSLFTMTSKAARNKRTLALLPWVTEALMNYRSQHAETVSEPETSPHRPAPVETQQDDSEYPFYSATQSTRHFAKSFINALGLNSNQTASSPKRLTVNTQRPSMIEMGEKQCGLGTTGDYQSYQGPPSGMKSGSHASWHSSLTDAEIETAKAKAKAENPNI